MLVDEFGGQAVASMLLGRLDVLVDHVLRLEPLIAALIGAGERSHTSMVHLVIVETVLRGKGCRTASVGAGELREDPCKKDLFSNGILPKSVSTPPPPQANRRFVAGIFRRKLANSLKQRFDFGNGHFDNNYGQT